MLQQTSKLDLSSRAKSRGLIRCFDKLNMTEESNR